MQHEMQTRSPCEQVTFLKEAQSSVRKKNWTSFTHCRNTSSKVWERMVLLRLITVTTNRRHSDILDFSERKTTPSTMKSTILKIFKSKSTQIWILIANISINVCVYMYILY